MKKIVLCLISLTLVSCSSNLANKISFIQAERNKWEPRAKANNAEAQYKLGNSYCCGSEGFFDRNKAVYWWCRAAGQGHSQARLALAEHKIKQCRNR